MERDSDLKLPSIRKIILLNISKLLIFIIITKHTKKLYEYKSIYDCPRLENFPSQNERWINFLSLHLTDSRLQTIFNTFKNSNWNEMNENYIFLIIHYSISMNWCFPHPPTFYSSLHHFLVVLWVWRIIFMPLILPYNLQILCNENNFFFKKIDNAILVLFSSSGFGFYRWAHWIINDGSEVNELNIIKQLRNDVKNEY